MTQTYVRITPATPPQAANRIEAYLAERNPRSRADKRPTGILPQTAVEPVLAALRAQQIDGGLMALIVALADAYRVREAGPLLMHHATRAHRDLDGYQARIVAAGGAALVAPAPAQAPEQGYRILEALAGEEQADQALREFLLAFVAYAPVRGLTPLEHRLPVLIKTLDARSSHDDRARFAARNAEDFALNDIPRAQRAIAVMESIRRQRPGAARLDALVAIHLGEDLRFRELLAPFAVRELQDLASTGAAAEIAAAFLRAYYAATGEPEEVRRAHQAIAAQGAAWFGAEIDQAQADAARQLTSRDAGIFGTAVVPR